MSRTQCPACTGEGAYHDRRCPDRPKRPVQPHCQHLVGILLSTSDRAALDTYRGAVPVSGAGRGLIREGIATKVRPVMAHNTSPNGGDCWSETDFATLPLDNNAGVSGCRLEVPVEDGAIVRLYPVEDGAMPAWISGGWYWVMP